MRSLTRWVVSCAVLVLALLTVQRTERADGATSARSETDAAAREVMAAETGYLDLTQLRPRKDREPTQDLFTPHTWREIEEEDKPRNATPPNPLPAQLPALPFTFVGKLIEGETTTVFLAKGETNYVVRQGDRLDGDYRVDGIDDHTVSLVYLPLDKKQTVIIGSPSALSAAVDQASNVPRPLAPDAPPTHDLSKLVWNAPSRVELGEEFTIEIGLPAGPQPRAGRVELIYDAMVLAILGGAQNQSSTGQKRRAVVEVIGPGFIGGQPTPSEVRFRVLAASPTDTQIGIENLSAVVAGGGALTVDGPKAYKLAIVQSSSR